MVDLQGLHAYFLEEMKHSGFKSKLAAYRVADWDLVAQQYFNSAKKDEESAQAVLANFALVFNAYQNRLEGPQAHRNAGQALADFIFGFYLEATKNSKLTAAQAEAGLRKLCEDLFKQSELTTLVNNELKLDEHKKSHFKERFYARMNAHLEIEEIFSIPVKKTETETQPIINLLLPRTEPPLSEFEMVCYRYKQYTPVLELLLDSTSSDDALYFHIKRLMEEDMRSLLMIIQLINMSKTLHAPQTNGRFAATLSNIMRNHPEIAHKFLSFCNTNCKNSPALLEYLHKIKNTKPMFFGKKYYYQLNPQARPPEKEPGTIGSIMLSLIASRGGDQFKESVRHYVKSNFTYAGLRAQGPALYWGLMGTLAVFTIFGGLATFGILPLTLALFTIPGLGTMTIGNFIVPTAGTIVAGIATKVAGYVYGKEINKNLSDELDLDDSNEQIKAKRKDLVLHNTSEPELEVKHEENEEQEIEDELLDDEAYKPESQKLTA